MCAETKVIRGNRIFLKIIMLIRINDDTTAFFMMITLSVPFCVSLCE